MSITGTHNIELQMVAIATFIAGVDSAADVKRKG